MSNTTFGGCIRSLSALTNQESRQLASEGVSLIVCTLEMLDSNLCRKKDLLRAVLWLSSVPPRNYVTAR
jgi:hypothetical protein